MGTPERSRSGSQLPWLALLLALLAVGATLQAETASTSLVQTARTRLSDGSSFFDEHPYLLAGRALQARRSRESLESHRRAERESRGDRPIIAGIMRRQQQELDGMLHEASTALDELPARQFGLNPNEWRPVTLLTYVLMHSGAWHLAGNVLLLVLLGLYIEPALGRVRSAVVVLCATLGAGLGHAFALPGVEHVLIGSSGLLAGLLAVFAWTLRESRDEGFYPFVVVGGVVWLVLPAWLDVPWSLSHPGVELLGSMPGSRWVYWSYAGGIVGAVAAHLVLGLLGGRHQQGAAGVHSAKTSTGSAGLDEALSARAAGRDEAAFQQLTALLAQEPDQLDAALLLSDVARSLGRHDRAEAAMLRAIRIETRRGESVSAVSHWLDLTQLEVPQASDPALLIRIATLLRHHDHPHAAAQALRAALDRAKGSKRATVATQVARSAKEFDPKIAHDAAWRALGTPELSIEERQNLEKLLSVVIPKLPGGEVLMSEVWERYGEGPTAIEIDAPTTRILDLVSAVPLELDDDGVLIATRGGSKKRVPYERIQAIAAAAVQGFAQKPVLVLDLVLNWNDTREPLLRVIRMRADRFDPRRVVPAGSALESFRHLVETLLSRSDAKPLPDRDSALGNPFAAFDEPALYERIVLMAEAPLSENEN